LSQLMFRMASAEHGAHAVNAASEVAHGAGEAAHHAEGGIQLGVHWTVGEGFNTLHVDTIMYTVMVMTLCLVLFGALGKFVSLRPASTGVKRGSLIEQLVGFIQGILRDFVGHDAPKFLWYIGSLFVFILVSNWLALLPWRAWELYGVGETLQKMFHTPHPLVYEAPTADLNTTAALAIASLAMYWVAGISKHGLGGFLNHHWFAKPAALAPVRIIEDVTRPLSLALRLFANIVAGHIVGVVLLQMTLVGAAALLPLELFVGAIQAFIFSTLSASYIGGAVEDHH